MCKHIGFVERLKEGILKWFWWSNAWYYNFGFGFTEFYFKKLWIVSLMKEKYSYIGAIVVIPLNVYYLNKIQSITSLNVINLKIDQTLSQIFVWNIYTIFISVKNWDKYSTYMLLMNGLHKAKKMYIWTKENLVSEKGLRHSVSALTACLELKLMWSQTAGRRQPLVRNTSKRH